MKLKLQRFGDSIRSLLDKPSKVLILCVAFAVLHLLFQGSLFHIAKLRSEFTGLQASLIGINTDIIKLEGKIRQAKDPMFIEQQAKDRLDMAAEDELVFVFATE